MSCCQTEGYGGSGHGSIGAQVSIGEWCRRQELVGTAAAPDENGRHDERQRPTRATLGDEPDTIRSVSTTTHSPLPHPHSPLTLPGR